MNESMAAPDMFTTITAISKVQKYRVTYVSALLLSALVCIFLVAVMTVALILYTSNTISGRTFRVNHSLRLLTDCVWGIPDTKLQTDAKLWSGGELEERAFKFTVRYEVYQNLEGDMNSQAISLEPPKKVEVEQ